MIHGIALSLCLLICSSASASETKASESPPNVVFIIADDLAACLGSFGNTVCQTPHLDRLAHKGVRFDKAFSQFPLCGPSRASIMSGLYPHKTKVLRNRVQKWTDRTDIGSYKVVNEDLKDHPSLAGFFREQGYYTARISKIYHMGIPTDIENGTPGEDDPSSWDYTYNVMAPETKSRAKYELLSPKMSHVGSCFSRIRLPDHLEETQPDVLATSQAIALLERRSRGKGQPFFLALGYIRPHVPLVAPVRLFNLYPEEEMLLPFDDGALKETIPLPARVGFNEIRYGMSELQKKQAIAAYYASVTFMDEQVGRILDAIDRLNLEQKTIVIFMSDHGFNMGEHDSWQKLSLFEDTLRVPLIVYDPRATTNGTVVTDIAQCIDLYPTLADLCGLKEEIPLELQGESLAPYLNDQATSRPDSVAYSITLEGGESLRTLKWRYNSWGEAGEELYDHRSDHLESRNLVSDPEYQEELKVLRAKLEKVRQKSY